jgi:hypothetical protein
MQSFNQEAGMYLRKLDDMAMKRSVMDHHQQALIPIPVI